MWSYGDWLRNWSGFLADSHVSAIWLISFCFPLFHHVLSYVMSAVMFCSILTAPITLDTIAEAIALWEKDTCIRFIESTKRFFQPHVNFRKGSG